VPGGGAYRFTEEGYAMVLFGPNVEKLEKQNSISGLLKCLDHKKADVRYSAFVALAGKTGLSGEVIMRLRKMMDDPDPWVKTIATLKFAELGDTHMSGNLMEIITEGSRKAKIDLLRIIAGRGATDDQDIMQVIMNALADKNEIVMHGALTAAGATRNRHLMQYCADLLHEKHHQMRIYAAQALYDIGGDESVDYLIGLLADREPEVVSAARSYLSAMDVERARKALNDVQFMQLIRGMNDREPVRRETARKIGDESIREGLPLLHRACRDKYKGVRIQALRSIAAFRDPSSIEFVAKLLGDKFHDVRLEAVHTLDQIIDTRSLDALKGAVEDRDKQVREAAQRAYDRMRWSF
jgi:HEAT repeat protein